MIDLTRTKRALTECLQLVNELDGQDLDETGAVTEPTKGEARKRRAQMSQDLQLLASRLELAASLARVEYWYARGNRDPIDPSRRD